MNLNEIYHAIAELTKSLPAIFQDVEIDFPLKDSGKSIGNWADADNMGMLVTGDGVGHRSGVYFFAKPDGTVFYIGKAANLHHRVWDHVNTPRHVSDVFKEFPNHAFRCNHSQEEIDCVATGSALLGVATLSDPNVTALVEVYLHTQHIKQSRKLPALNKQIG